MTINLNANGDTDSGKIARMRLEALSEGDHLRMKEDVRNIDGKVFMKGTHALIICTNRARTFFTLEQEIAGRRHVVEVHASKVEVIPQGVDENAEQE